MNFNQFSVLGIIINLLVYIIVGMAVYSPLLFGKVWQKNKGLSGEDLAGSGNSLILSTLSGFLAISMLYVIIDLLNYSTPLWGLMIGLIMALFAVATNFNLVVYDKSKGTKNRLRVWLIDSFNTILVYALAGAVFGILL